MESTMELRRIRLVWFRSFLSIVASASSMYGRIERFCMYSRSAGRQGMSCTDIFRSSDCPALLCAGRTDSREISMRLLVLALMHWLEQASASGNGLSQEQWCAYAA